MALLIDPHPGERSREKLLRLLGVLTFICLNGTWDENGISKASKKDFLDLTKADIDMLKNYPYGDIFKDGVKLGDKL